MPKGQQEAAVPAGVLGGQSVPGGSPAPKGQQDAVQAGVPAGQSVPGGQVPKAKGSRGGKKIVAKADGGGQAQQKEKARPGRPPKDVVKEVHEACESFAAAGPDDPLWSGAEVRTQVKLISTFATKLQTRLSSSKSLEESTSLQQCQKAVAAITAMLEVQQAHGLDADPFVAVYDYQHTVLQLAPTVSFFKWPSHIQWNRHRHALRSTDCPKLFLSQLSTTRLAAHGVKPELIEEQQARILAERIAMCTKKPTLNEVRQAFSALFKQDHDYDFEEEINGFCDAMVVGSSLDQLQGDHDIGDLSAFVTEAVGVLETAAGEGAGRRPTKLGSSLTMHPKGRLFYQEVRATSSKIAAAATELAEVTPILKKWCTDIQNMTMNDSFITSCEKNILKDVVCGQLENIAGRVDEGKVNCGEIFSHYLNMALKKMDAV